jgi:uncharacterized integral membrane protein
VVIVLRSNKFPFIKTSPSLPVILSLLLTLIVGFLLSLTPGLNPIFSSLTQQPIIIGYIFAMAAGYIVLAQFSKMCYIKLFNSWL